MPRYSTFQKILSYFYPVKITSAAGKSTPLLSLYLYFGRWQLGAATALYSDGKAYKPLKLAFDYLGKNRLTGIEQMLVLGSGLGSAIDILKSLKCLPTKSLLVDIDPQIIDWASDIHQAQRHSCTWLCKDVNSFLASHNCETDFIILDIFEDRTVPRFVCQKSFLLQCMQLLRDQHSVLVFNYIINSETDWENDLATIDSIFEIERIIEININRILILKKRVTHAF